MVRSWVVFLALVCSGSAYAGAPVTGRSQHMSFSRAAVQAVAAQSYHRQLQQLSQQGKLDKNKQTFDRVKHISSKLIAQAIELKPAAAHWPWEVHITSDPQVAAYSMAGGKLLISTHFIDAYALNDDELAVALAHEIGHVIAEHVREQMSLAASFEVNVPNRVIKVVDVVNSMESDIGVLLSLQPLSRLQEMEADDIGIELAARAGIPPSAMLSFYAKLVQTGSHQSIFDTHGSPYQRAAFVESMASFARLTYEASRGIKLPTYAFVSETR